MPACATHDGHYLAPFLTRLGCAAVLLLASCTAPRSAASLPTVRAAPSEVEVVRSSELLPAVRAAPSEIEVVTPALQDFYSKRLRDGAIPILAHASVADEALFAARDRLRRALERAPKLRRNLESQGFELHIQGLRQFASDLPEYRTHRGERLKNGQLYDWHMVGGHITGSFLACAEGTLLPIVGYRLFGDETCFHELGHMVEWRGLDAASRARLAAAYRRSIESGHWKNQYAATNQAEWFAEATKFYFRPDGDALAFYDPSLSRGREWLRREDPGAFQLVDDLYAGRTDPGAVKTVPLVLGPGRNEAALKSKESVVPSTFYVHNATIAEIRLVWVDFEGHRDRRQPFEHSPAAAPGGIIESYSWATHTFVVTDASGRTLCTLTAAEETGAAEVKGVCD
jgi:hypothetical protein